MTPTKLLFGQIIVVFTIVIGAVWGAMQFIEVEGFLYDSNPYDPLFSVAELSSFTGICQR